MKQYTKFNNISGWAVFAIAAWVFLSTIEMTGSFWDCGEFIAAAYKLQIGHPPGAPADRSPTRSTFVSDALTHYDSFCR